MSLVVMYFIALSVIFLCRRVYDSSNLSKVSLERTIRHNNYTGRRLTNFRAVWHPTREDCFVIGSKKSSRQV